MVQTETKKFEENQGYTLGVSLTHDAQRIAHFQSFLRLIHFFRSTGDGDAFNVSGRLRFDWILDDFMTSFNLFILEKANYWSVNFHSWDSWRVLVPTLGMHVDWVSWPTDKRLRKKNGCERKACWPARTSCCYKFWKDLKQVPHRSCSIPQNNSIYGCERKQELVWMLRTANWPCPFWYSWDSTSLECWKSNKILTWRKIYCREAT